MCLIALAWRVHPRWPLVLVANRDEAHARPAVAAGPHPEHPGVYGGRDLLQGGGWLQVGPQGRLAAVTNVRRGLADAAGGRSRGGLVTGFVAGGLGAEAAARALERNAVAYGRFNLLLADGAALWYVGNHPAWRAHAVPEGVHAVSNGDFGADWPKSRHAAAALSAWLEAGDEEPARLFAAMADESVAADAELPDTGVPPALERALSPAFIRGRDYGTRATTLALVAPGRVHLREQRFGPDGQRSGATSIALMFASR
ncbi:NRDE family protein [Coralloluteibacterium thermophilus]|uniref:NRDE family protein n=1 Tax=Coralloluteibacterium thermophilum TaxID=2707049 RepID=A0ABV9NPK5_9GAMM